MRPTHWIALAAAVATMGCTKYDTGGIARCGNGIIDEGEVCDGADFGGASCADFGYPEGELGCAEDCSAILEAACTLNATCGDNLAEGTEACDGTDLAGASCESLGWGPGVLTCQPDCTGFDTAGCPDLTVCGDQQAARDEVCDGDDLRGRDCTSLGFSSGPLACLPDCSDYDDTACMP